MSGASASCREVFGLLQQRRSRHFGHLQKIILDFDGSRSFRCYSETATSKSHLIEESLYVGSFM
jgi:hypothetical protein